MSPSGKRNGILGYTKCCAPRFSGKKLLVSDGEENYAMGLACISNKRLDGQGNVRVGDFGLAEDIYTRGYFRQSKSEAVKLPFKWMAPESLRDGLFSEKSDVVRVYAHLHPNTMTCTRDMMN